jgi:CheY-like chemotaxis protein
VAHVTVMVIEDEATIRELESEILTYEGYDVRTAVHGRDALNQLGSGAHPDVIVLDVTMPVMDGISFREKQLSDPALSSIPVVVASAMVPVTELAGTRQLQKPFSIDELLGAIAAELRQRAPAPVLAAA